MGSVKASQICSTKCGLMKVALEIMLEIILWKRVLYQLRYRIPDNTFSAGTESHRVWQRFYQKNPGSLWQQAPKWAESHPHFTCFNCCSQVKNQPRATLWLAKQKLCWVDDSIPKGSSGQHSKSPEIKEQHFVTHFILQLPHNCHSLANTENDNELFAFWPGYLNIYIARYNEMIHEIREGNRVSGLCSWASTTILLFR